MSIDEEPAEDKEAVYSRITGVLREPREFKQPGSLARISPKKTMMVNQENQKNGIASYAFEYVNAILSGI